MPTTRAAAIDAPHRRLWHDVALLLFAPALLTPGSTRAASAATGEVAPVTITRAAGEIVLDGELDDAGWQGAATIDRFWETSPADNVPAKVTTVATVTYDDRYLYVAVRCDDPDPGSIRAPYVDRDGVVGTDDNVAIFLDPTGEGRTAVELRVSPRGIQADGTMSDATGNEDFAPDFFYDTAARITATGWQAELRIPFSSLRYPEGSPQTWGIMVWRNYPRDYRYAFYSTPIPRGSSCYVCHLHPLVGLENLPRSRHLVAAPYVTAAQNERRAVPGDFGSPLERDDAEADAGLDVKWSPTADSAIDVTINPDFSQIEADAPQIAANERLALFFPEKRPFFLEGIDLLGTPMRAVYTRTITAPRWGGRATGRVGATSYTALVAEDRGGGLVILPQENFSIVAPQEREALVGIGRVRHDLAHGFVGLLATARENDGGSFNRVFGPDLQWRPTEADRVTAQLLWSETENPPELAPYGTFAREGSDHAAFLSWAHQTESWDFFLQGRDIGENFRTDTGFVRRAGYRQAVADVGRTIYPEGLLRRVRFHLLGIHETDRGGDDLESDIVPGVAFGGTRNLDGYVDVHVRNRVRVGERILEQSWVEFAAQIDPGRRLPRVGFAGSAGEAIDFENAREGDGATVTLFAVVRPVARLDLRADVGRRWLDVDDEGSSGRLFTASFERLRATWSFSQRARLRLIGQYEEVERDPDLYLTEVDRRDGDFLGSLLFSYELNWQTVLFVGFGDNRALDERHDLRLAGRSAFFKVSYALQR